MDSFGSGFLRTDRSRIWLCLALDLDSDLDLYVDFYLHLLCLWERGPKWSSISHGLLSGVKHSIWPFAGSLERRWNCLQSWDDRGKTLESGEIRADN